MSDEIDVERNEDITPISLHTQQTPNLPLEPTKISSSASKSLEEFNFAFPGGSANKTMVVEEISKYTYPTQMTNSFDRENWLISTDHCYARPWNWRPESSFLRPTKTLFVPRQFFGKRKSSNPLAPLQDCEDVLDVESISETPVPVYDFNKARILMEECEKYAFSARSEKEEEDWEEKISKINWTPAQNRIFSSMLNILSNFHLAKLAYSEANNEPLLRRITIDKAVQRVRRLLSSILWEPKLTQWLHQLLIDNLEPHYLSLYLDILQTLKSKLPTFVDKMMCGPNSSQRVGSLNNSSLQPLLERPWDPVASSLSQDKPKKLPGNPIIIVVPTAPIMSKVIQKWVKLFSHLATVVTIPTNFGQCLSSFNPKCSTGHRMTIPTILDQLFSITRGKIQDVRADYPGRHIILVGFNAGATLALQVAQVEPVMCVVSLGFALLTAEGRRGEPDDTLLELQCPVLFVIGQCSNTSTQEDMEDLRERMRVETGLIVVGSADDFLRVDKKKKKAEGITQSIVDRCIVDEVGEFVSGIILSPYPPQIRQSPSHIPDVIPKKSKIERKRYNSNTSSLDSEPPSPTPPRITRPVGRPPGSKSKTRLETKWAQQIAQGNANPSPSPSPPPPYPTITTPDTSSTDSSTPDRYLPPPKNHEYPVKKLKTLKPVNSEKSTTTPASSSSSSVKNILPGQGKNPQLSPSPAKHSLTPKINQLTPVKSSLTLVKNPMIHTARMQAYGLNKSVMQGSSSLSTLLQGGIKTIPPAQRKSSTTGIKVLENVTLNSSATAKLIKNRTIDLSKLTLINSAKSGNTSVGNVLLLPDGKLKTIHSTSVKGTGGTPILLPLSSQNGTPKPTRRYITGKRQLIGQKPPRPVKKTVYLPATNTQASLPPPTNLTTQDIMDLPIIFADDNQILDSNLPSNISTTTAAASSTNLTSPPATKIVTTVAPAKYMLINKQTSGHSNFVITPTNLKKPNMITFSKPQPKYTKIILSSKKGSSLDDIKGNSKIQSLSPEITIKKVLPAQSKQQVKPEPPPIVELIDLENEIKATAVPKPNLSTSDIKNVTTFSKNSTENFDMIQPAVAQSLMGIKRPPSLVDVTEEEDPDYIPPKTLKYE